ncbi:hypothetical protein BE21_01145 [Sorangium cellulosum]|uniref:Uncharacterized protein n=1 Tax=Sorangium cellulosum TaxID=56 RepID=A0A150U1W4_SORCE|nr:hypothetical protein BE21_01145 [Sorangium cellulosum]
MALTDALIDQISFRAPPKGSPDKIDVLAPAGHWITASILQQISWFALGHLAAAVAQRHGFGVEEAGIEYPTDREPDEDTFEGVRMYALDEEMFVSAAAFDRLMLRFFETMAEIAAQDHPAVTAEPWWPEYTANVEAVRRRAHE